MAKDHKDFFRITDLTKDVTRIIEAARAEADTDSIQVRNKLHLGLVACQVEVQLAIAQQLTMLAQAVRVLVDAVERETNKTNK